MQQVIDRLEMLRRWGQRLGPYVLIEILLPGGSLFALMLFLYQRRKAGAARPLPQPLLALVRAFAGLAPHAIPMLQPCYSRGRLARVARSTVAKPE